MDEETIKEIIKESIQEIFYSEDEFAPFNNLQDTCNRLIEIANYEERLECSRACLDKFEDYMKNVDRLNQMINEFKGLVSIVRGETQAVKKQNDHVKKQLKKLLETLSE